MRYALITIVFFTIAPTVAQTVDPYTPDGQDIINAVRDERTDFADRLALASAAVEKLKRIIKRIDTEQDVEQDAE